MGVLENELYFLVLLVEFIMRFQTMKNVLYSIKNPFTELMLTVTLWFILLYWFTLLAYVFLQDVMPYPRRDCVSLIICFGNYSLFLY